MPSLKNDYYVGEQFHQRLNQQLVQINRGQRWLAKSSGVSSFSYWFTRQYIPSAMLPKMIELLECSREWLTGETPPIQKIQRGKQLALIDTRGALRYEVMPLIKYAFIWLELGERLTIEIDEQHILTATSNQVASINPTPESILNMLRSNPFLYDRIEKRPLQCYRKTLNISIKEMISQHNITNDEWLKMEDHRIIKTARQLERGGLSQIPPLLASDLQREFPDIDGEIFKQENLQNYLSEEKHRLNGKLRTYAKSEIFRFLSS